MVRRLLNKFSNSLIFNNNGTNKLGEWLYTKVETAMGSMSGGLLDDPVDLVWDPSWDAVVNSIDNSNHPNHKIAYYDFIVRDGHGPSDYEENKNAWSSPDYETCMSSFKASINYDDMTKEQKNNLIKDNTIMKSSEYKAVLECDEIGRLVNVLGNGIKIMDGGSGIDFANLESDDLSDLLTSINDTDCLRICSYNAMILAKSSIGSNDFVDIDAASFEYMITTHKAIDAYDAARIDRQTEIDHISTFYSYYKDLGDENDTIEFERKKSKKKFVYNFVYKSPEINEKIGNLEIDAINLKSAFNIKEIFRNITLMVAYKRGIFQQLPLFATDTQLRDKTFEYTKEQSENFPF